MLSGVVYVANNATLTIEPGTIVRCSNENTGALVITRGAKIKAAGTRLRPIVFTSDKSAGERRTGDWGGISIQGNAPINTLSGNAFAEGELLPAFSIYGGDDVNDDSGVLKFVRIEFAGQKVNATKEMNGLSLCGVGAKTIVENIQISYSNDDAIEWYGGTVSAKRLVAYKTSDDDFDMTMGYTGTLDQIVAIRHPLVSDISGSRAVEIDGYTKKSYDSSKAGSTVIISNATFISLTNERTEAFVGEAIALRRNAKLRIENSLVVGFRNVADINSHFIPNVKDEQAFQFVNSTYSIYGDVVIGDVSKPELIARWYSLDKFKNVNDSVNLLPLFKDLNANKRPDFRISTLRNVASQE